MKSTSPGGAAVELTKINIAPSNKSIAKGTNLQFSATGIFSDGTQKDLSSSVTWKASPSTIARISAQGNVTGIGQGVAQISADYQGTNGSASITVGPAALVAIAVNVKQPTLPLGDSEPLRATGSFSDGTQQDISSSVNWQANPPSVATISAQGNLTGVGKGVGQVSAFYQGLSGSATVNVGSAALVGIAVSLPQASLPLGGSEVVMAMGSFSDGTTQDLTQLVAWQASPASVATITAQGSLTGAARGVAQISATYQGLSGTASVSVGAAALLSIAVGLAQSPLPLGKSETATAIGNFSDGTTQNLTQSVVWSSSAPAIASVSAGGAVVGNALGVATLSASIGSVSGSANLNVTAPVAVALNVTPATSSILLGNRSQLQATATFSDGTTQDMTGTATWSSDQPNIVSVSGGEATAEQDGTATISATSNTLSGSATVTVTPLMTVSYFNRANLVASGYDSTLRLVNPGVTAGDLCAMIYVFDRNQELNECCGCKISKDGERTLSLLHDLTANPLTGIFPVAGSIHIVPSDPDQTGLCNAGSLVPDGMLAGWETNVQSSLASFQITEIHMANAPLADVEAQVLTADCSMLQKLGSAAGTCTCGTGD